MSFEIDIRVDPQPALQPIAKVQSELGKVEQQGPRAGQAITHGMRDGAAATDRAAGSARNLGEALARVGNYHKILATEAARTRQAVDNLASAFGQLGERMRNNALQATSRAFAGLVQQLEREQAILERIHGPAREHAADLRSLEMLYRRGAISAAEYHREVSRMNGALAGTQGGGSSLMAMGGKVMAGVFAAKSIFDLSDSYTGLENRLKQVAKSQEELNFLMARTRQIADDTRSDWRSTAEAYVRLTNATKEMGLSQERALAITETLNMALQSSGATSAEAAAGTLQLMQGLAAGALQGDEFRSIAEQLPDLLDLFAKQMGVSRGELKKLGAEGKITAKVVVDSLEAASDSIRDKFIASTATAGQQWTVFKNQLTQTAGELVRSSRAVEVLGAVLNSVLNVLEPVAKVVGVVFEGVSALGGAISDFADALGVDLASVVKYLTSPASVIIDLTSSVVGFAREFFASGSSVVPVAEKMKSAIEEAARGGSAAFEQWARESDEFKRLQAEAAKRGVEHLQAFNAEANRVSYELMMQEHRAAEVTRQYQVFAHFMANGVVPSYAQFTDIIAIATIKHQVLTDEIEAGNRRVAQSIIGVADEMRVLLGLFAADPWDDGASRFGRGLEKGFKFLGWDRESMRKAEERRRAAEREARKRGDGFFGDPRKAGWNNPFDAGDVDAISGGATSEGWRTFNAAALGSLKPKTMSEALKEAVDAGKELKKAFEEATKAAAKNVSDLDRAMHNLTRSMIEDARGAVLTLGDAFVDAFTRADFSWRSFFDGFLADIMRMSTRNLLTFGMDALGLGVPKKLPGAATGGSWTVGGSGGTDSQIAMLRVTPREQITVETPGQAARGERPSGGSKRVVYETPDGRRTRFELEDEIDELVIRSIDRHMPELRARLTGR